MTVTVQHGSSKQKGQNILSPFLAATTLLRVVGSVLFTGKSEGVSSERMEGEWSKEVWEETMIFIKKNSSNEHIFVRDEWKHEKEMSDNVES